MPSPHDFDSIDAAKEMEQDRLYKARRIRDAADTLIGQLDAEGRHLMAHQVARAFSDVPDESMATLHDILMRVR